MKKRIFSSFLLLLMVLSLLSSFPITAGAASTLKSSANLIQVVKDMEGFKNKPYWDNGHWAIGYGTTCPDELVDTYNKNGITVAQAEEMLKKELTRFETAVRPGCMNPPAISTTLSGKRPTETIFCTPSPCSAVLPAVTR